LDFTRFIQGPSDRHSPLRVAVQLTLQNFSNN
jgi:hypothetical protein